MRGDPVIHGNSVLNSFATPPEANLFGDQLPEIAQMNVTRHKLRVNEFTTAIIGLPKSLSVASGGAAPQRVAPAIVTTMVVVAERYFCGMLFSIYLIFSLSHVIVGCSLTPVTTRQ